MVKCEVVDTGRVGTRDSCHTVVGRVSSARGRVDLRSPLSCCYVYSLDNGLSRGACLPLVSYSSPTRPHLRSKSTSTVPSGRIFDLRCVSGPLTPLRTTSTDASPEVRLLGVQVPGFPHGGVVLGSYGLSGHTGLTPPPCPSPR